MIIQYIKVIQKKKEDLEYELKMISDTFSSYFEKLLKKSNNLGFERILKIG